MKNKSIIHVLFSVAIFFSCSTNKNIAQQNTDLTSLKFIAEPATDWANLFYRKHGWFGADGIFSIPLNGIDTAGATNPETMLLFSDTMLGDIVNDSLKPGYLMIHNSVALLKDNEPAESNIHFYWDTINGKPIGLFTPNTPSPNQ